MKTRMAVGAAVLAGVVVATATAAPHSPRGSCPPLRLPRPTPAGQQRMFGQVVSLRKAGARYVLRFRPAWLLSGHAAEQIMLAKTGSRDVPNDSITVDSHRLFSFLVSPTAKVVVLGPRGQPCAIPTTVAALAAKPKAHPNHFWIRLSAEYPNPVLELEEQYHP